MGQTRLTVLSLVYLRLSLYFVYYYWDALVIYTTTIIVVPIRTIQLVILETNYAVTHLDFHINLIVEIFSTLDLLKSITRFHISLLRRNL